MVYNYKLLSLCCGVCAHTTTTTRKMATTTEIKKVRIVDIARMAGVSTGTVDRVIHHRGRIAADKKERIEKIIDQLNYKPNLAAKLLATARTFTIGVVAPNYTGESYWKQVSEGCERVSEEIGQDNIKIEFLRFDQYDRKSFDKVVADVDWSQYDGVVIATLFEEQVKQLSQLLDTINKPYIYIDSQVEEANDLAYFGVNAYDSGYIAGKMLCREVALEAPIAIAHIRFRRSEISTQMRKRESGFLQYLADIGRDNMVEYIEHDPDNEASTIATLKDMAKRSNGKIGIIVLNSRAYELADFLEKSIDTELREQIVLVGFEAIKPNIEAMNRGLVQMLISQRAELQGYNAVKALSNLFLLDTQPNRINYTPIDILIPENIQYYSE